MKSTRTYLAAIGAIALMGAGAILPASAETGLANQSQTMIGVSVRVLGNDPNHVHPEFSYQGHQSNQWYPKTQVIRTNAWDAGRQGYDCYDAFQYTWVNHAKAREDTTFCFDAAGQEFEPEATRASARLK